MASLPYVTSPGNIERALAGIKSAATPERVTQDFVKTILKIPGGSGDQITSFLRKTGFANGDGSPSDLYKKFRNPATAGQAAAEALRLAYAPLYKRNEFMHCLSDQDLRGLVMEETGSGEESSVPGLILSSINAVKKFAKFDAAEEHEKDGAARLRTLSIESKSVPFPQAKLGMNLSYTINLNLPATSDVAVFNAIFKSLKEHLLRDTDAG
jgi:hypothetical protein